MALLERTNFDSVLIFCRTKQNADRVAHFLKHAQHAVAVLHSNRTQRERVEALEGFKSGKYEVMVATDIASRGLDIAGVSHVINYDVPEHPEDYVHRIGRTGRAQNVGDAFTKPTPNQETTRSTLRLAHLFVNTFGLRKMNSSVPDSQTDFDRLQKKLVPLWKSIERFNQDPQTIVVVPSMSIDAIDSGAVIQAYEERFLFLLLLLRQPRARLIYVTSRTILPSIIDYYLDLLPGVIPSHAWPRLFLPSPMDGPVRPLSQKLLERQRLVERIRSVIMDPDRAHLVPFNTTNREKELALRLGVPMYGADPKFFPLGTKSGCRKIFTEENVPHPLGHEDIGTKEDLLNAIAQMRTQKPSIEQVMVKLNEGVSGEGNAIVDLNALPVPGSSKEVAMLQERLRSMQFELEGVTYDSYMS